MYRRYIKRVLDIFLVIIILPVFTLIFLILAPIIYFTDKGPVFYIAPRIGRNGKLYKMYKFRSMYINAPDIRNSDGSTFNSSDDPRVTPIGRFIRKSSLDETAQCINILLGTMSFIGPRPDLPTALEKYTDEERIKLQVRPGITGYNQAYYRNSVPWRESLKNDVYYVNNLSFILDIKILFKTIITVVSRKGINRNRSSASAEDKKEMTWKS